MYRSLRAVEQPLQFGPPGRERLAPPIAISLGQQIEEHDRGRHLRGKHLHPRSRRLEPKLLHWLLDPPPSVDELRERHAAVTKLASAIELREELALFARPAASASPKS